MSGVEKRAYLGDGLYASFDGYQIWLGTQTLADGWQQVALEPGVFRALLQYAQSLNLSEFTP